VISDLVTQQPVGSEAQLIKYATASLFITWGIGIVDSLRVGLMQEKLIAK